MKLKGLPAVVLALGVASQARAAEVRVLAAAAPSSALHAVAGLYEARTGNTLAIEFATGPEILARISAGETVSVVVAPEAVLKTLGEAGKVAAPPTVLGRVGIALAVRNGAARPDISSMEAFRNALLRAKTVVFSRGTFGVYVEGMIRRIGLEAEIAPRVVRVANGGAVVDRLAAGTGDEIGLSAATELQEGRGKGVGVVALIPPEVQNYTAYALAPETAAAARPEVAALVALIADPQAQALIKANGLD